MVVALRIRLKTCGLDTGLETMIIGRAWFRARPHSFSFSSAVRIPYLTHVASSRYSLFGPEAPERPKCRPKYAPYAASCRF